MTRRRIVAWLASRESCLSLLVVASLMASCASEPSCGGASCDNASTDDRNAAERQAADSPTQDADGPQSADSSEGTSSGSGNAPDGADSSNTGASPSSDASLGAGSTDAITPMTMNGSPPGSAASDGGGSGLEPSTIAPNETVPDADAAELSCPDLDLESGCHDDNPCDVPQGAEGGCSPGATQPITCGGVRPIDSCSTDEDCAVGHRCDRDGNGCNASRRCLEGCTADADCAAHERCDERRCNLLLCNEAGALECEAGTLCSPGAERANALGCEPLSCTTSSYDCAEGWRCAADSTRKDKHDCESILCNEPGALPCPSNTRCTSFSDTFLCRPLPCTTSADCECGVCIGGACYDKPGQCSFAFP
jgi:hypothetical protein